MSEPKSYVVLVAAGERAKRWLKRLLAVVVAVLILWWLLGTGVGIITNGLWFHSVQAGGVYTTMLRAQIILFVIFGGIAALAGWASLRAIYRSRPLPVVQDERPETVSGWRRWLREHPRLVTWGVRVIAIVFPGIILGRRAAGQWQTFELWRHASSWGVTDPTFHRDVSYFVEVYPMHRLVVGLLTSTVMWVLLATLIAAVHHGILRLHGPQRITRYLTRQVSMIGAIYLLLRAAGFWLDRMALVTSNAGPVTGAGYTETHAIAPAKLVLIVVFVLAAALLVANALMTRPRVRRLGAAVAVCLVFLLVAGAAWPALVTKFREQPSASTLDLPAIRDNEAATMKAFGLAGNVDTTTYGAGKQLHGAALDAQAKRNAQIRVLDPNQLTPTFNVKQQIQAYYGFKSTLDVDRYPVDGKASSDVAIAARELHVGNISRSTWANQHLVYTHGYGVVAAPTDSLDSSSDVPEFLDGGMPPAQQIPVKSPQIYFGQSEPNYSIVGQPAGSTTQMEFDHPGGNGHPAAHTTYDGGGGVPIGSTFRRLLYAIQMKSPNILTSGAINSGSRLLSVRDPRARVSKVAPWLTLDGDAYPAVVDGNVDWVVDGYTTSSNYPDSELTNLHQATTSTLTSNGSSVAQPNRSVNYMRNSVKATVDAKTGAVTLYEWNQQADPDPLLKTWESVFPGLVKPQSDMPASLLAHIRYPQDLFDVQRSVLTHYHVADASDFYSGNDFWKVPADPTVAASQDLNKGGGSGGSNQSQPSVYMSLSSDGFGPAQFSLSTPLVTLNGQDLAGFLSVDSQPGPDYGKFKLLQFPSGSSTESPAQVQNDIESDTDISEALTLQRGGNSKVVLGNLLAMPLGGKVLYVEPIYTQANGGSSFPILRHVVAIYGNGSPGFSTDLKTAMREALASGDKSSSS